MSLRVLKSRDEVVRARRALEADGLSCLTPAWRRRLPWGPPPVGDWIKSWDLELTVRLAAGRLGPADPVLDIGAMTCELVPSLSRAGFRDLTGIDLTPDIRRMPAVPGARWVEGDFMSGPFPDGSFAAVTAVSVIEHGYDGPRLFREVARVLRPGGLFAASFDYWPEKVDTAGVTLFGLDWRVFSEAEAREMLAEAARHGLEPLGELDFTAGDRVVDCLERRYTFAWTALRKAR